jgi:hypothetical protein
MNTDSAVNPRSMAAEYKIGLKSEPTCRRACVARLNLLRAKSKPPTMARIWPVRLSTASSAPSTTGACSSMICVN